MTEKEKRILHLLERLENNEITPEEAHELDQWYASFEHAPKLTDQIPDAETEQIQRRMLSHIRQETMVAVPGQKRSLMRWRVMAVGLVVLAVVAAIVIHQAGNTPRVSGLQYDVAAGKHRARLLIPGYADIDLEKAPVGLLYQAPGLRINKDSAGLLSYRCNTGVGGHAVENQIIIPSGGTFRVLLSDGSEVWMNANSQLRFLPGYSGHERKVALTGEAYFEVAKDKSKPFFVQTPRQRIRVLGTHFNVHAYPDERSQKTTLLEGLVQITTNESVAKTVIIKPGQQIEQNDDWLQVRTVDAAAAIGWKNGLFVFDHTELQELMLQLSRWYNVKIVYRGQPQRRVFSGEIPRSYSLGEVLRILELGSIHFSIEQADHPNGIKKLIINP
jgi:transmembrane sensor